MENGISMSDVLALQKTGGTNGDMSWIILLIFLFAFGGGGFWGGNRGAAVNAINTDMEYTNLMNSLGTLGNATSRGFDTLSNQIGQGFAQTTNQNFGLAKDIDRSIYTTSIGQAGLSRELCDLNANMQRGFCGVERAIDNNRFELQKSTCDIITNANYNTRDLTATITAGNQNLYNLINDKFCDLALSNVKNQLEEERFKSARLENQLSNMAQSAHIIDTIAPTARPMYNVCNPREHGFTQVRYS